MKDEGVKKLIFGPNWKDGRGGEEARPSFQTKEGEANFFTPSGREGEVTHWIRISE